MLDLLGLDLNFAGLIKQMVETKSVVVSPIYEDLNSLILYQESEDETDEKLSEPKSLMIQPIFDTLNPATANVTGVVVAVIEWTDYFDEDLGSKTDGMVIDLEYACGRNDKTKQQQVYSFEKLTGGNFQDLGMDFVHDSKYEHLTERMVVANKEDDDDEEEEDGDSESDDDSSDAEEESGSDDSPSIFEDEERRCSYYVSVHATENFVQNYETNDVIIYSLLVVSIFVLTGLVFLIYDCLVEKRQKIVLKSAMQSGALVSSLFPDDVSHCYGFVAVQVTFIISIYCGAYAFPFSLLLSMFC